MSTFRSSDFKPTESTQSNNEVTNESVPKNRNQNNRYLDVPQNDTYHFRNDDKKDINIVNLSTQRSQKYNRNDVIYQNQDQFNNDIESQLVIDQHEKRKSKLRSKNRSKHSKKRPKLDISTTQQNSHIGHSTPSKHIKSRRISSSVPDLKTPKSLNALSNYRKRSKNAKKRQKNRLMKSLTEIRL